MFHIDDFMIEFAEKLFLPQGESFDQEIHIIIRCMELKDMVRFGNWGLAVSWFRLNEKFLR